jgi:hypothetical protein
MAMGGSKQSAKRLTEGEIGATLARMGLLAPGDALVCVPLHGQEIYAP